MKTPWHTEEGKLKFPYRAIRDIVFIYPDPPPAKIGKEQIIELPEELRKYYNEQGVGTLLSVGPGYTDDSGKWHPTSDQLKPGVKVRYDKTVPWSMYLEGLDGKPYKVVLCGYRDLYGVVE